MLGGAPSSSSGRGGCGGGSAVVESSAEEESSDAVVGVVGDGIGGGGVGDGTVEEGWGGGGGGCIVGGDGVLVFVAVVVVSHGFVLVFLGVVILVVIVVVLVVLVFVGTVDRKRRIRPRIAQPGGTIPQNFLEKSLALPDQVLLLPPSVLSATTAQWIGRGVVLMRLPCFLEGMSRATEMVRMAVALVLLVLLESMMHILLLAFVVRGSRCRCGGCRRAGLAIFLLVVWARRQ